VKLFLPSLWDLWDFPTGHQQKAWQIDVILLMLREGPVSISLVAAEIKVNSRPKKIPML
jgi:hypothetical protein